MPRYPAAVDTEDMRPRVLFSLLCAAFAFPATPASALEWSAPTPISSGAVESSEAIAVGPDGAATVVYAANTGGGITLMAASRAAGSSEWSIQPVSGDLVDPDDVVDAVAAADGSVTVAWVDAGSSTAAVATRGVGESAFGSPTLLGPTTEHVALAVNTGGDTVLTSVAPGFTSVWAAHRPSGGAWSAPETVIAGGSTGLGWPTVIADKGGAFHLAVARNSPSSVLALRLAPGSGTWDPTTVYSGAIESEGNPIDLAVESDGGVTAIWQRDVSPGKGYDPLLTATRDGSSSSWSLPVDPTGTDAAGIFPTLAALGSGSAQAYWTSPGFGLGASSRAAGAWSASSFPTAGYAMAAYPHPVVNAAGSVTALTIAAVGMGPPIDLIARTDGDTQVLASNVALDGGPPPVEANRFGAITTAWVSTTDQRLYVRETPGDYAPAQPGGDSPAAEPQPEPAAENRPPATLAPLVEALLSGKTIRINARLTLKPKKRCGGKAMAQLKVGKRAYRAKLKVKSKDGVCRATGTIRLRKAPAKKAKLRVKVTAASARARTLAVTR